MEPEKFRQEETADSFRESLRDFERCGFNRPSNASLSEYLAVLVDAEVLPRDDADLFISVYYNLRFGQQTNDVDRLPRAVEMLYAAAQLMKEMNPDRREQISRQLQSRFALSEVSRPIEFADSPLLSRPSPPAETLASPLREPESDFSPLESRDIRAVPASETSRWSRRRRVIAYGAGALFWTVAVLVGGNFWHDEISLFVHQTRVGLGWEDPHEAQQTRRNWSVTEDRSPAPSEFEVIMNRAAVLERNKQSWLAMNAYELALNLDPNHALANNNLAWLLLTCEDTSLRDPVRALPLAKLAVQLEANAAYLDTLAEAWYQNGDPAQAVEFEEKAWSLEQQSASSRNRGSNPFLKQQLAKFREALRDSLRAPPVAADASSPNTAKAASPNDRIPPAGSPPATKHNPDSIPPAPTDSPPPPPLPESR